MGKPQLGRWAFYWEGVFGAAQNVGRFWCRYGLGLGLGLGLGSRLFRRVQGPQGPDDPALRTGPVQGISQGKYRV
eukprot:scaffold12603_cov146-Isochrysis_galbana.AAC.3